MRRILFLFLYLSLSSAGKSYSQQIDWLKCYGGSEQDDAFSIKNTFDNGLIVVGSTMSGDGDVSTNYGQTDCWIVKLDTNGEIQWEKNYGGSGTETAYTIQPTSDNGYIFAGATNSYDGDVAGQHGYYDVWVVKIDSTGNIMWQNCLGGSNRENAYCVNECFDGGFILAGYTLSDDGDISIHLGEEDAWVIKLDKTGNLEWEKTFGSTIRESANVIIQTPDKGFLMGGAHRIMNDSTACDDAWIVKMDSLGNKEWEKTYGGLGDERIYSLIQTDNQEFVFAASASSTDGDVTGNHGSSDFWIVGIDNSGILLWQKCLGGSSVDAPRHISLTEDNGYIISGDTWSDDGDVNGYTGFIDAWIIRTDSLANLKWQKCIGSVDIDMAYCSAILNDEIFVLGSTTGSSEIFSTNHGSSDFWVAQLSVTVGIKNILTLHSYEIYPNPTRNPYFTIKSRNNYNNTQISCYNAIGKQIHQQKIQSTETEIDVSVWPAGIYLVVIHRDGKVVDTMKLIVK
jgi:hypothetical protein